MINPDAIREGDTVTLSFHGGEPEPWTVCQRRGTTLMVEHDGDVKTVPLSGKRAAYQIVAHRPWLPA
jgi:hypothetical protein